MSISLAPGESMLSAPRGAPPGLGDSQREAQASPQGLVPPPIPHPLWSPGGRQSKYAVNAFEVFDIETRSWTKFPNIPCKRAFSSFVTVDDRLYSLGGLRQGRLYRQPKFLRTMDMFDMEQGELGAICLWMTLPSPHCTSLPSALPGPLTQLGEPFRCLNVSLHSGILLEQIHLY